MIIRFVNIGGYVDHHFAIDDYLVFNSYFSAISWRPVLVMEEAGVPHEKHRPWASNW